MAQCGCVSVSAAEKENILPLIFKELTGNIPNIEKIKLYYIKFEMSAGTKFKVNGIPNQVPSSGVVEIPYINVPMTIKSVEFEEGCSNLKIWFLF